MPVNNHQYIDGYLSLQKKPVTSGGSTSSIETIAEVPSGTVDGINTSFTILNTPINPQSVILVIDGITQYYGIDYTVTGKTISMTYAPSSGSTIYTYYNRSV